MGPYFLLVALDVILALFVVTVAVYLVFASRNAVHTVMSPRGVIQEVAAVLDLPERGVFYDLGCGDGRILAAILARWPLVRAVGVDNNPVVLGLARLRLAGKADLRRCGIMSLDLSDADRVFTYLGPGLMAQLEPKLEREMPRGARLVSQQFPLPARKPDKVVDLEHGKSHARRLYVYDY
jgi:SAM-dependent methyltransferase